MTPNERAAVTHVIVGWEQNISLLKKAFRSRAGMATVAYKGDDAERIFNAVREAKHKHPAAGVLVIEDAERLEDSAIEASFFRKKVAELCPDAIIVVPDRLSNVLLSNAILRGVMSLSPANIARIQHVGRGHNQDKLRKAFGEAVGEANPFQRLHDAIAVGVDVDALVAESTAGDCDFVRPFAVVDDFLEVADAAAQAAPKSAKRILQYGNIIYYEYGDAIIQALAGTPLDPEGCPIGGQIVDERNPYVFDLAELWGQSLGDDRSPSARLIAAFQRRLRYGLYHTRHATLDGLRETWLKIAAEDRDKFTRDREYEAFLGFAAIFELAARTIDRAHRSRRAAVTMARDDDKDKNSRIEITGDSEAMERFIATFPAIARMDTAPARINAIVLSLDDVPAATAELCRGIGHVLASHGMD